MKSAIRIILALTLCAIAMASDAATLPRLNNGNVADHFKGVTYDPAVPSPESVLGYPLGSRPVRYDEMLKYLTVLDEFSTRAELVEMGQSHEGRALYYMVIGTQTNFDKRESIRADMNALASPSSSGTVDNLDGILSNTPAVAWLGYSIHGDEISGVDACLWVAYHLLAAQDAETKSILDNVLVLLDPNQNPDGRERYLAQVFAWNGKRPSTRAGDLQHGGFWPWGRANHYLFDMNRDWLPLVHPETNARVEAILKWCPQVVVDAHEMGAYSTFLFSPGREPLNLNITPEMKQWWDIFAGDQGAEFDKRGWSYYTGDWHEEWYPGYGSSWCLFTGALGILYEQAGADGSSITRHDGSVHDYPRAVAQQAVSSIANLSTTARNRRQMLSDYAKFHRDGVLAQARDGLTGAYVFSTANNPGREAEFLSTIKRHGIRVEKSSSTFQSSVITSQGDRVNRTFQAGTYIIPMNQPRALLAHALLEFDPHLKPSFLEEERRSLEKGQGTRLYEISGWSMALGYDLDISYAATRPGLSTTEVESIPQSAGSVTNPDASYGFLLSASDDRSMPALVELLDAGLSVRVATKGFVHQNIPYDAGTLIMRKGENGPNLVSLIEPIAKETGVTIIGTSSNYSSSGIDLGSDLWELLRAPRVGLFWGSGVDFTSSGWLWYEIDYRLQTVHSLLDINQADGYDLSSYNVLILPSTWGNPGDILGEGGVASLKKWVQAGGTLIAVNESAFYLADSSSDFSSAREYGQVLDKLEDYNQSLLDERSAFTATVDTNAIWRGVTRPTAGAKPGDKPSPEDVKKSNDKSRTFGPQGVIVRLDLNPDHWLNFGTGGRATAIIYSQNALLAKDPVQVAARIAGPDKMRLSGLLWPEARERWANTAYCTRESMGKGQVILFADEPFFRAYFHGTRRLLENAILLGPGVGTSFPAPW
jgi:hypothetical protein